MFFGVRARHGVCFTPKGRRAISKHMYVRVEGHLVWSQALSSTAALLSHGGHRFSDLLLVCVCLCVICCCCAACCWLSVLEFWDGIILTGGYTFCWNKLKHFAAKIFYAHRTHIPQPCTAVVHNYNKSEVLVTSVLRRRSLLRKIIEITVAVVSNTKIFHERISR